MTTSDILLSAASTFDAITFHAKNWKFGKVFCTIQSGFIETAFTALILTLTTLSLARYFSICKPFSSQARYISKSYKRIIQIIWCLAIIIQIPSTATYNLQKDQCINNRWGSRNRLIIYAIHSAILFLTPLALTTASHLAITLYLYRHNTLISTISYRSSSTSSSGTVHIHNLKKECQTRPKQEIN